MENDSLGGILSWYSLIHTEPEAIDTPLAEFARCIRLGGRLALGFFTGPELGPFDHAVTTAYFWPVEQLARRVEEAGFVIEHTETRTDTDARPHAAIIARRTNIGRRSGVQAGHHSADVGSDHLTGEYCGARVRLAPRASRLARLATR